VVNQQQATTGCPPIPVQDPKTAHEFVVAQQAMQHEQLQYQAQQAAYSYHETLAHELGDPAAFVIIAAMVVFAGSRLIHRAVRDCNQAEIAQNDSDNRAEIEIARLGGRREGAATE
jgi:hypothetical protein